MTKTVTIEKQVWESTLNRSMELQAENDKLKKWCEELNAFALKAAKENAKLKELLKEVKDYLPEFETPMDILAKIDEVLNVEI